MNLCEKTARRLRKKDKRGRTVTTKVRFEDFTTLTRQRTMERPVCEAAELYAAALENLVAAGAGDRKVRLIGVTVSGFGHREGDAGGRKQTLLFDARGPSPEEDARLRLARAEDAVKDKFGEDALRRGASMRRTPPEDDGRAPTELEGQ